MKKTRLSAAGLLFTLALSTAPARSMSQFSHGDPTPDEQYLLELINRARANPPAEGQFLSSVSDGSVKNGISYFKVDMARVRKDFSDYPVRPPLAFNARLMASSRSHSADMAKMNFQDHIGSNGSTVGDRTLGTGYPGRAVGESIYSNLVPDVLFAHAGFQIDWGPGEGGVQTGLGHRLNIMNYRGTVFNEIGIGVVQRTGSSAATFGKYSITQDFGLAAASTPYLLGVVYSDRNSNGICDPGEGVSGVSVTPSTGAWYAVTSASGGYAIPFNNAARGTVTFSGGSLPTATSRSFSIGSNNVKVDMTILPDEPVVTFKKSKSTAGEGRAKAKFQLVRTGNPSQPLVVTVTRSISRARGNALPNDYKVLVGGGGRISGLSKKSESFRVTIAAGKSSALLKIKALKDNKTEPAERVTFGITDTPDYALGSPSAVKIKIAD